MSRAVRRHERCGTRGRLANGRLAYGALACGLVALGTSSRNAFAFCRTTTVPVISDYQPSPTKCWDQGVPLYWKNACVSYNLQRNGSRQVAFDAAANAISSAFAKWTGSSCPTEGKGRSRVSIDVRDLGSVDCGDVKYNQTGPNQNVIVFRDGSWPHNDSSNTLALTTVTFNPDTGEIYDADMEVNTAGQSVSLGDVVPPDGYDFASIMTHEAGHFLGIAHSGDSRATMFANYIPGGTAMRNLTADDVAGICSVYLPDGKRAVLTGETVPAVSCDPTPRRGFIGECAAPPKKTCTGSAQISTATPVAPGWVALGVGLAAALGLRRAARREGAGRSSRK